MVTLLPISKPISHFRLEPGSRMTIPDVSWVEYEAILAEMGDRRRTRVAYSHNTLEITVPRPDHELPTDLISDIVKTILRTSRIRYQPFGSTTFKQQGIAGLEPDACFYVQNYERMIGRRKLEVGDPPPDLAIETDVTSLTAIEAYKAIAVPEVWIYAEGRLRIYRLELGEYVVCEASGLFPTMPIVDWVEGAIDRAWTVGSLQALEEIEDRLREMLM
jgi:Uma2 family endonuclease